jgi:hypothetical protein
MQAHLHRIRLSDLLDLGTVTTEDLLISLVVFAFSISIIPMIRAGTRPPLSTGLLMTVGSAILAGTYIALGLWLSVAVEVFSTIAWGILLHRSMRGTYA